MNQKESKPMGVSGILKWVVLAVFLLVAGCLFSCGASEVSMEIALSSTDSPDDETAENEQNRGGESLTEAKQKAESETLTESERKAGSEVLTKAGEENPAKDATATATGENEKASRDVPETASKTVSETAIEEAKSECFVYVCGEVRSPGVYCMEEGQRIFEAVEQAGGFTDEAVREYLNLADEICDGMKIFVPSREQVQSGQIPPEGLISYGSGDGGGANAGNAGNAGSVVGVGKTGSGSVSTSAKVNLNTASKEELMTLKGIGSARAEDIIRYREKHGGFQKIEDIKKVSGIKETTFEKIRDQITV